MTKADGDVGLLQVLLTAADVRRFLCDDKILSEAESAAILSESDRLDPEGLGLWPVEAASGVISSMVGLLRVSGPLEQRLKTVGGVEPTIALDPLLWGRGIARPVLSCVIAHARDALLLLELVAAVDLPNKPSRLEPCQR